MSEEKPPLTGQQLDAMLKSTREQKKEDCICSCHNKNAVKNPDCEHCRGMFFIGGAAGPPLGFSSLRGSPQSAIPKPEERKPCPDDPNHDCIECDDCDGQDFNSVGHSYLLLDYDKQKKEVLLFCTDCGKVKKHTI